MEQIKSRSKEWDCPICFEVMDGAANGQVSISTRCFHSFHKKCLYQWMGVDRLKSCPTCRMDHDSITQIIPNPDFSQCYKRSLSAPDSYTYEDAYKSESLRPLILRGQLQNTRRIGWREQEIRARDQYLRDHPYLKYQYQIDLIISIIGTFFVWLTWHKLIYLPHMKNLKIRNITVI